MEASMELIPPVQVTRFEQLEPGELFIYIDGTHVFYALKTLPPATGDRSTMVVLGPSFPEQIRESFLLPWQPVTVLSLGRNFSVLPSLDPALWSLQGPLSCSCLSRGSGGQGLHLRKRGKFADALFRLLRRNRDGRNSRGASSRRGFHWRLGDCDADRNASTPFGLEISASLSSQ
jgi:hypothetical protein